jgi:hypothetical protein
MGSLKLKLNGYRSLWTRVYIGVTADPVSRWNEHSSRGWTKMVLLYKAFTPQIASSMERALIRYARDCNFRVGVENVRPGGEGIGEESRPNYLYVLLDGRKGST